jgi:hypothetical protein
MAGFRVTQWHLVKQGGRDEGGTGPLVGWVREEMGSRGRTMMTTTIIRRRAPLSSLVPRSRLRATSPTVRHHVSSLTSQPSSWHVQSIPLMCHVIDTTWRCDGLVCAVVVAAGARSVVGDVALRCGGGPLVLV